MLESQCIQLLKHWWQLGLWKAGLIDEKKIRAHVSGLTAPQVQRLLALWRATRVVHKEPTAAAATVLDGERFCQKAAKRAAAAWLGSYDSDGELRGYRKARKKGKGWRYLSALPPMTRIDCSRLADEYLRRQLTELLEQSQPFAGWVAKARRASADDLRVEALIRGARSRPSSAESIKAREAEAIMRALRPAVPISRENLRLLRMH